MAKKILAVYDSCRDYVERFLKYAAQKNIYGLRICGFTDPEILEESISGGRIDAVLFSPDKNNKGGNERISALLTKSMQDGKVTVIILGEQPGSDFEEKGFSFIYKYQKADTIIRQILEITGLNRGLEAGTVISRGFNIHGIYAPWDKSSHPETAARVAKMISSRQTGPARILYINLEPFSGMSSIPGTGTRESLSDIIYYFRTRPEQLSSVLRESAGNYAGMDVLTAPGNPEDLEEIDREEWPDFLEAIAEAGNYHNIILDISDMEKQLEDVIFKYGNLYIPALPYLNVSVSHEKQYDLRKAKMAEYRDYIKRTRTEEEIERIYEIKSDADR